MDTNYFTGMIIDQTQGATTDNFFNSIIRTGIAAGSLPEEISDIFVYEVIEVDGEERAIVSWA